MRRLLLAEDKPETLAVLRKVLEGYGYQVDGVSNGAAALEALNQRRFDCLVVDLILPLLSGLELVRETRQINPGIPILVLSAYQHLALQAVRDGANGYLMKPCETLQLKSFVERWVGPSAAS